MLSIKEGMELFLETNNIIYWNSIQETMCQSIKNGYLFLNR
ncbi:Uncharacterised protein [Mycobacterium tuberculosis]|nr:Uncharacterised protein [Mycobacterium tuberculosis]CKU73080.1 Uncharacterised protein [Mycobacterium tuberculosis]CKV36393.1 Uncharacterised protein [Mycobacterium tuberculosis]